MSAPQSLIKRQRFLGMLNYFGNSISNIAAPLGALLKRTLFLVCKNHRKTLSTLIED